MMVDAQPDKTVVADGSAGVATSERSVVIDNARAIGILLVVVGHAPAIAPWLSDTIFAFHMPLFFFLSGAVIAPQRLAHSFRQRAAELARSLLLPYLFFFTIAWAYWLLAKRHGLRSSVYQDLSWWDPLAGLLMGTGDALYVDPALWFFPCLFVTAMVYHALRKLLSARATFIICVGGACALILGRPPTTTALPWSIDCAVVALAFYAAGPFLRDALLRPRQWASQPARWGIASLALAVCVVAPRSSGHVDLSHMAFGLVPVLYLPVAACGAMAVLLFAGLLPASPIGRWLSVHTVVIFPLHMLFFSGVTGVATVGFEQAADFKESVSWIALPYVAAALAGSWIAAHVLHRAAPWLFGRRPDALSAAAGQALPLRLSSGSIDRH